MFVCVYSGLRRLFDIQWGMQSDVSACMRTAFVLQNRFVLHKFDAMFLAWKFAESSRAAGCISCSNNGAILGPGSKVGAQPGGETRDEPGGSCPGPHLWSPAMTFSLTGLTELVFHLSIHPSILLTSFIPGRCWSWEHTHTSTLTLTPRANLESPIGQQILGLREDTVVPRENPLSSLRIKPKSHLL